MALMRFDPFREIDRLTEHALAGARTARSLPMEALRRGDQFVVALDVPGMKSDDIDVTVERNVIEMRFGAGDHEPQTLSQAGKKLGVSTERARQLEERALRKLSQRPELIALREAA